MRCAMSEAEREIDSLKRREKVTAEVKKNVDTSKRRKKVALDVAHPDKLTRIYAEGVILLGPDPPYRMKLYPLITMSARLREMAESDGFGEENFVLELPACPGDHDAFKVVETFSYGLENPECELISTAAKLVGVCDFLNLESLCARVLKILEKHVESSFDNCLSTFATLDYDVDNCQTNKTFGVCSKFFLGHIIEEVDDEYSSITMESLFRIFLARFSPRMTDLVLNIIAGFCEKHGIETIRFFQEWNVDSLKDKSWWFRKLSNLKSLDYTKVPTEAAGKSLDAARTSSPVSNFVMQEIIRKEQQASSELKKLRKDLKTLRTEHNSMQHELDKAKEELGSTTHQLNSQGAELKKAKKDLAKATEKNNRAVDEGEMVKEDDAHTARSSRRRKSSSIYISPSRISFKKSSHVDPAFGLRFRTNEEPVPACRLNFEEPSTAFHGSGLKIHSCPGRSSPQKVENLAEEAITGEVEGDGEVIFCKSEDFGDAKAPSAQTMAARSRVHATRLASDNEEEKTREKGKGDRGQNSRIFAPLFLGSTFSSQRDEEEQVEDGEISVPDPEFSDFDNTRTEAHLAAGQIWAMYDDQDGMPRFYALITRVVLQPSFRVRTVWLNSKSTIDNSQWIDGSEISLTCGEFEIGPHYAFEQINCFSHIVVAQAPKGLLKIFPKREQVWAVFRDWSADERLGPRKVPKAEGSMTTFAYEMVLILSDFSEERGVDVATLVKVQDFNTLFCRKEGPEMIRTMKLADLQRFSHSVPVAKVDEDFGFPIGTVELDPAALPSNVFDAVDDSLKGGHL